MIVLTSIEVYSDAGKYVHRIGSDVYFTRATIRKGDTADMYEEVDEVPKYTEAEYKAKVEEKIRERYTTSDELAILRQRDTKPEEYEAYFAYAEECKQKVREDMA